VEPPKTVAPVVPSNRSPHAAVESVPFPFREGDPVDELGAYAKGYWGENGLEVFRSAASVHEGDVVDDAGVERLLQIGRYAAVQVRARHGFYLRDFGERGWVIELEARDVRGSGRADLVIRYRTSDEGAEADRERWQTSHSEPPQVISVTHFVLELWSFRGELPELLFVHETDTWANCCGSEVSSAPPHIQSSLKIEPGTITMFDPRAWRATAETFHPRPLEGIPAPLTPWTQEKERVFRFDGHAFLRER